MDFVAGLTMGLLCAVAWRCFTKERAKKETPPPPSREQRQLWHEYQNFLNYDGEEQAEFSE